MIKPNIPSSGSLPSGTKTDVQKVAENISDVVNVSSSISNGLFNKVVSNISETGTVATGMDQVITVAQIHDAVNAVALNQKTIDQVASELAIIGDCSVNMSTLLVLQGHLSKLLNIESSLTEIKAVGKNEKHINSVFEAIPDIATVISHMEDIHFIGQNHELLVALHADLTKIVAVAGSLTELVDIADNLQSIKDAAKYVSQLDAHLKQIQTIKDSVDESQAEAKKSADTATEQALAVSVLKSEVDKSYTLVDSLATEVKNDALKVSSDAHLADIANEESQAAAEDALNQKNKVVLIKGEIVELVKEVNVAKETVAVDAVKVADFVKQSELNAQGAKESEIKAQISAKQSTAAMVNLARNLLTTQHVIITLK